MRRERDIAVVLSGGAVNGLLMELGFMKRLRESELWPRVGWIYGTSSGAMTGLMAALDRLDDLEQFMLQLQPEELFRPHSLWRLPLLGSHDYRLPATIEERLGDLTEIARDLAASPVELVVFATDVSQDVHGRGARAYELTYSSRSTPPETMAQAVLASSAVSALVLPRQVGERLATDGAWVRNFPLGHAYRQPGVELIVSFRYVPNYPRFTADWLVRMRRRLERFPRIPPVKALISELREGEQRVERGEPAHWGDMIVRLMRVARAAEHRARGAQRARQDEGLAALGACGRMSARSSPRGAAQGHRIALAVATHFASAEFPSRQSPDSPHRADWDGGRDLTRDRPAAVAALAGGREARIDRAGVCAARRRARRAQCRLSRQRRDDLAGIHDPVRVEQILDAAHHRQQVAVLEGEVGELPEADAVLAGARAAARQSVLDDARVQLLRLLDRCGVIGVEEERDVEVAVADVTDDAAGELGLLECTARLLDRTRRADRHRGHRSSSREPGESASDAISALCRALHICARAAGSLSDSKAVAPSSSASSRVVSRSPATPASLPPNSTNRYGDSGNAVPLNAFSAAIVIASRSSQRSTGTPTPMIAAAARHAASTDGNAARATTTWSGIGCRRSVSSVITPSVPSEPTKRLVRL